MFTIYIFFWMLVFFSTIPFQSCFSPFVHERLSLQTSTLRSVPKSDCNIFKKSFCTKAISSLFTRKSLESRVELFQNSAPAFDANHVLTDSNVISYLKSFNLPNKLSFARILAIPLFAVALVSNRVCSFINVSSTPPVTIISWQYMFSKHWPSLYIYLHHSPTS
jgi:hypothetical protein